MRRLAFAAGLGLIAVFMVMVALQGALPWAKAAATAFTLFSDDFESGSGNWTPQNDTNVSIVLDGGTQVYSVTNGPGSIARTLVTEASVPGSSTWKDYAVQARVMVKSGGTNYAMLMARVQNAANYYFMTVRLNGRVELRRYQSGATTLGTCSSTTIPSCNIVGDTWYTATLEVKGNTLRALIDGTPVLTGTDDTFAAGSIGVGTDRATGWFDDVIVIDLNNYTLAVTTTGTGDGVVTSDPAGIVNCGTTCSAELEAGTVVTLTATPDAGSSFAGWMGGGCIGTGDCVVTMNAAKSIAAVFASASQPMLLVHKAGTGNGTVTSVPAGIDCGITCTAGFTTGTVVTLTAAAASDSEFTGWSGACGGGSPTCTLTMDASKNVTATFRLAPRLSVSKSGNGSGTVTSDPTGIDCGVTCAANFDYGAVVTLTATPAGDSLFTGWSGACAGGASTCVVTMTTPQNVIATFMSLTQTLTVGKLGSGSGTVTSDPAGIDCGATCSASFAYGTVVTLTAAPAGDSTFLGWPGACSGRGVCVTTMTAARNIAAAFAFNYSLPFTDDFESGAGKWTPMAGNWSVVTDGTQVYSQSNPSGMTRSIVGSPDWTDYTFQARVKPMGGAYASLIARYQDDDNYYFMALRSSNKVEFKRMFPGGSQGLGSTNYTFVPGTWYTATFVVSGTTLYSYINGELVHTVVDSYPNPLMAGMAGVGTLDSGAEFDDVVITMIPVTLTVSVTGTGSGLVTSTPAGINCGAACSAGFMRDSVVTLTATPQGGSSFAGWIGAGCAGTGACIVRMDAAKSVVAVFSSPSQPMLVVNKDGNAPGLVTSVPAGIDCGTNCWAGFAQDTIVTLTATSVLSSTFTGWSGACVGGSPTCTLTMDAAKNVTATFMYAIYPLTVTKAGNGAGTVTSVPPGISCGLTCTANVGGIITLTAVPAAGSGFAGWTGACSGTGPCVLFMDSAKNVTATFSIYYVYLPIIHSYIPTITLSPVYVATTGNDSNPGTITEPFKTLHKAVSIAGPGQTIYVRGGTHYYTRTIVLSQNANSVNMLKILAYPGEHPVLDFSGQVYSTTSRGFEITGSYWHLKGLEIQYAGDNGIYISGHHNIIEQCVLHHNRDTGLQIGLGSTSTNPGGNLAAYNQVINCDSYRNYDPPDGGDADGFAAKLHAGKGNVFRGCRAWENSDDGWDLFDADHPVVIEDSWTWHNGDKTLFGNPDTWGGNGNGFKLGGNRNHASNVLTRCIAFDNVYVGGKGFDQNNNLSGVRIYNSLSFSNTINYAFATAPDDGTQHELKNNVGFGAVSSNANLAAGTIQVNNSWNLSVTADANDYLSLLVSLAQAPRQADGSLPNNDFARLVASSDLIDKGVDVGLPYCGAAPDLGPFERCP